MSTLKVTNIQDTSGGNSLTTAQLYSGSAKAWVNFDGTGSSSTNQTIRASFNVSSVYKNGTGDYTVNFTNAFADANYSPCVSCSPNSNYNLVASIFSNGTPVAPFASYFKFYVYRRADGQPDDTPYATASVFR